MDNDEEDDDMEEDEGHKAQAKPAIDLEILAQKVFERLMRELFIENERIGR